MLKSAGIIFAGKASDVILEPREHFFSTIIGMDLQKELLRKMWSSGHLPHTLLFSGAQRIGKHSLAFALGKYVNCERGRASHEVCDCRSCALISRGLHPDLFLVEPQGATRTIQIDQLRQIQDIANVAPIEARKKVIIFTDADTMNPSSANSALKLLEEPPSYLLLLLLSTRPHQLLPTVKSRCAHMKLTPIAEDSIERWLAQHFDASESTARLAAAFSGGIPGLALELVRKNYLGRRDMLIREIDTMLANKFPALFGVVEELSKRFDPKEVSELLAGWYRDILISKFLTRFRECLVNKDACDDIERMSEIYSHEALFSCMKELMDTHAMSERVINKRLVFFVLLLRLGKLLQAG